MNPSRMYTFFLAYLHGRERLLMSMGVHNLFLDYFFFTHNLLHFICLVPYHQLPTKQMLEALINAPLHLL